MLGTAIALITTMMWDTADCMIIKNYVDALRSQEELVESTMGEQCGTLFPVPNDHALCEDWRATYMEGQSGDMSRAEDQLFQLAEARCTR